MDRRRMIGPGSRLARIRAHLTTIGFYHRERGSVYRDRVGLDAAHVRPPGLPPASGAFRAG
jgi:hypothetical protein